MIALEQARQHLESLGLKQAVETLDNILDAAASKQLTYPEMLAQLLDAEVNARRERYLSTRTKMAHLPLHRTLDQFDFSFQPSTGERQVRELASLASWPRLPISCCWGLREWARPTWPSPWPSGPLNRATALTSSAPTA